MLKKWILNINKFARIFPIILGAVIAIPAQSGALGPAKGYSVSEQIAQTQTLYWFNRGNAPEPRERADKYKAAASDPQKVIGQLLEETRIGGIAPERLQVLLLYVIVIQNDLLLRK